MNDRNHPERIRNVTNFTGDPVDTLIILSTLSIGIIVSFAWRDAVDKILLEYFPSCKSEWKPRFIYAVSITVFAVILIYFFSMIKKNTKR